MSTFTSSSLYLLSSLSYYLSASFIFVYIYKFFSLPSFFPFLLLICILHFCLHLQVLLSTVFLPFPTTYLNPSFLSTFTSSSLYLLSSLSYYLSASFIFVYIYKFFSLPSFFPFLLLICILHFCLHLQVLLSTVFLPFPTTYLHPSFLSTFTSSSLYLLSSLSYYLSASFIFVYIYKFFSLPSFFPFLLLICILHFCLHLQVLLSTFFLPFPTTYLHPSFLSTFTSSSLYLLSSLSYYLTASFIFVYIYKFFSLPSFFPFLLLICILHFCLHLQVLLSTVFLPFPTTYLHPSFFVDIYKFFSLPSFFPFLLLNCILHFCLHLQVLLSTFFLPFPTTYLHPSFLSTFTSSSLYRLSSLSYYLSASFIFVYIYKFFSLPSFFPFLLLICILHFCLHLQVLLSTFFLPFPTTYLHPSFLSTFTSSSLYRLSSLSYYLSASFIFVYIYKFFSLPSFFPFLLLICILHFCLHLQVLLSTVFLPFPTTYLHPSFLSTFTSSSLYLLSSLSYYLSASFIFVYIYKFFSLPSFFPFLLLICILHFCLHLQVLLSTVFLPFPTT